MSNGNVLKWLHKKQWMNTFVLQAPVNVRTLLMEELLTMNIASLCVAMGLEFGLPVMQATLLKDMELLFVMEGMNGICLFQLVKVKG